MDKLVIFFFEPSRETERRWNKWLAITLIGWTLCIIISQIYKVVF